MRDLAMDGSTSAGLPGAQASRRTRRGFVRSAAGAVLGGITGACLKNSGGPSGTPSPTPAVLPSPLPAGIANATAFQNLQTMIGYERIIRPQALLYSISCLETDFGGRCKPGYWWSYAFFYDTSVNERRYDAWRTYGDGTVLYLEGSLGGIRGEYADISALLQFDSDRAAASVAQLSRECIERYPGRDWNYQMQYQFRLGVPVVSAILKGMRAGFNSVHSEVYLDSRTGAYLTGDFICRPD